MSKMEEKKYKRYERRATLVSSLWKLNILNNHQYAKLMIKLSNKYDQ